MVQAIETGVPPARTERERSLSIVEILRDGGMTATRGAELIEAVLDYRTLANLCETFEEWERVSGESVDRGAERVQAVVLRINAPRASELVLAPLVYCETHTDVPLGEDHRCERCIPEVSDRRPVRAIYAFRDDVENIRMGDVSPAQAAREGYGR